MAEVKGYGVAAEKTIINPA